MKRRIGPVLLMSSSLAAGIAGARALTVLRQDLGRSPVQRSRVPGSDLVRPTAPPPRGALGQTATFPLKFRTIDGSGNNLAHPEWGAAHVPFLRIIDADYADGVQSPSGVLRRSPRDISNLVVSQDRSQPNSKGASDYLWMWGQFLDHDVVETPGADPTEAFDIRVPAGDPWFDPMGSGTATIPLNRSTYDLVAGVRQQINLITAYIDASNVYGSDHERAEELRTLDGTGRLKTSAGDLLPYNDAGLENAPSSDPSFFLAGDLRANEQVALTAMHTLFVREHNHWAQRLAGSGLVGGERIYQLARAIVGAEMQAITYREFLPVLLGVGALPPYTGYRPDVNAGIGNTFAAAGYRVGHTMLSPVLLRIQADGSTHPSGDLPLARAFFQPNQLAQFGLEPYLRGLGAQGAQEVDPYVIDGLRNFLFGPPGSGGFDLPSLNIQRGRDHGLASFSKVRTSLGYPPASSFAYLSTDPEIQDRLEQAYGSIEYVDAWVGLLAEDHVDDALVGETLRTLLVDQFSRLRDGDRFFYTAYMPQPMVDMIEDQTLAVIIRRNTTIDAELSDDVFYVE